MYFAIDLLINQHLQPLISAFIDWCIFQKFPETHNLPLEIRYGHVL